MCFHYCNLFGFATCYPCSLVCKREGMEFLRSKYNRVNPGNLFTGARNGILLHTVPPSVTV